MKELISVPEMIGKHPLGKKGFTKVNVPFKK